MWTGSRIQIYTRYQSVKTKFKYLNTGRFATFLVPVIKWKNLKTNKANNQKLIYIDKTFVE